MIDPKKKKPDGVSCGLTTWTFGSISVAANRYCEVGVSFGADHGPRTTFRLDPVQARELAGRLLSAADDAEVSYNRRVRRLPARRD